ncbi:MAG: type II 3-dehydroquinate dehydratase [Clostridiales bacterium]|nr:type II 3-dehydroquinate dehydratase [Clostridiales bacterium]
MNILVINGPNINMLGKREKALYGSMTYENLKNNLDDFSTKYNVEIEFFQSSIEGEIVDKIHEFEKFDGIIINPAAYSHYSIAILDALKIPDIPIIEVHISNVHSREDYRKELLTAQAAVGVIAGLGFKGYELAIEYIVATKA